MGSCLNHETTLDHIKAKARLTEDELVDLKAWQTVQEKKLALSKLGVSWRSRQSCWGRSWRTRRKKSVTPRTNTVRRRKKRYMSTVTLTPFWQSWEAPLLKALTTAFVKSKLLFRTWTYPMSLLMPRPRPQCSLSTPRAQMNYLLMMPLSMTLVVMDRLLLKAKLNPSWTALIILTKILPSISSLCKNVIFFFSKNVKNFEEQFMFNLSVAFYI